MRSGALSRRPRLLAEKGKESSQWIVVALRPEDLGRLHTDARWKTIDEQAHPPSLWRDDFSNIISVFKW